MIEDDPQFLEIATKYTKTLIESHKEKVKKLEGDLLLKVLNDAAEKNGEKL
jgi:hypothetical protein